MAVENATMTTKHSTTRDWSDLPLDILSLILERLSGKDRTYFHCVCSTWRSVPFSNWLVQSWTPSPLMIRFPLLMYQRRSTNSFYHPVYNTTYNMTIQELASAEPRFSKDGWLLMSQDKRIVFFINPFTKERINLPNLPDIPCLHYLFKGIAFSSFPTSTDCVVFGVQLSWPDCTNFGFIRHNEDTWTFCSANNDKNMFSPSECNPVFHKGVFYYLGIDGNLGEFDPNKEKEHCWTVHKSPVPCKSVHNGYLVEWNGDLLSIFEGRNGSWVKVYKLDPLTKAWKEISCLGKMMLFVSSTASFARSTQEMQDLGMENKIYFPKFNNNYGVFYSLGTRKFHTFPTGFSQKECTNIRKMMHCTWIEPNFEEHIDGSLLWYSPPSDSDVSDSDAEY